jgi:hypothetical protein
MTHAMGLTDSSTITGSKSSGSITVCHTHLRILAGFSWFHDHDECALLHGTYVASEDLGQAQTGILSIAIKELIKKEMLADRRVSD